MAEAGGSYTLKFIHYTAINSFPALYCEILFFIKSYLSPSVAPSCITGTLQFSKISSSHLNDLHNLLNTI